MTKMRELDARIAELEAKKAKKEKRFSNAIIPINLKLQRLYNKRALEQGKAPEKVQPQEPVANA